MQLNTWDLLNHWEDEATVGPPDCLPWIGSGWVAGCADQIYTLGWVCCETAPEPEPVPTTGGGRSLRLPSALERQRKLAIREDEEMLLALAAFMASRNKH